MGIRQNFKTFIEKKKIYVDKTQIIYELINKAEEGVLVVNGPRRTGKSLLLSTIKTIYTQNADWWKKYAPDLWITKNKISFFSAKPYPVVRFSFGACEADDDLRMSIISGFNEAITNYELETKKMLINTPWKEIFQFYICDTINELNLKFKKKAVILIDENDQPLIKQLFLIIEKDIPELRTEIKNTLANMTAFYTKIKEISSEKVEILVICGNSTIAQTSIYSGSKHVFFKSIF